MVAVQTHAAGVKGAVLDRRAGLTLDFTALIETG
jgi:hypothetical protein